MSVPLRVGYNCQLLTGDSFGVSNCIRGLARGLFETRGDNELLLYAQAPAGGLPAARRVVSPGFTRNRGLRILWEQLALPARARRDGLDVFHAPGYVMPRRMRVPTVLTVYDLLALTHPEFCKRANVLHYRALLPSSIRRARRITVCSEAVRSAVLERFGLHEERVQVVYPGIEPEVLRVPADTELEEVRRRFGLDAPFVLFVGNAEPKKNLRGLVEALILLRERNALRCELVVTGGAGWGGVLDEYATEEWIRRLSYVPTRELPCLYRLARLFAFPSWVEGFGLPVLEAMACGLPVVASPVPALQEADPRAGTVVDPGDVDSIASGLLRTWTDEDVRSTARRVGQHAAKSFTWERAARSTWQVYRDALYG